MRRLPSARKVVDAISSDGWYWKINEQLGGLYEESAGSKASQEAVQQYRLALEGFVRSIAKEAQLVKAAHGNWENVPSNVWAKDILELKRKIQYSGGEIEPDLSELETLRADFAKWKPVEDIPSAREIEEIPLRGVKEVAPQLPKELARAMASNDVDVLANYVLAASPVHGLAAIETLAKTGDGCAILRGFLGNLDRDRMRTTVVVLKDTETPDAIGLLKMIAETHEDPVLYAEAMEAVIKSVPDRDARRLCLEEAQKLADQPDAAPAKLMFAMRGLGQEDDPPEVRVLRKVLRRSHNEEIRAACIRRLAAWITDSAETRDDVLKILKAHLADRNPDIRANAARALGASRDVRNVQAIRPLLDDDEARVRAAAAAALCSLLDWERPILESPEAEESWISQVRGRLDAVIQALEALDMACKEPAETE